jgi:hypothetical protein
MIDTSKYEGRTPGQWSVESIRDGSIPWNTADEELCADAPLLLEEVKRLRKELNQTRECLWWCYDKERFGWEVDEEQWEIIGRLLGADTDHNDNEWEGEEE